jgi:hypothetical protein
MTTRKEILKVNQQAGIDRKSLTNEEFLKLRHSSEKIAGALNRRLAGHLEILSPLFVSRRLLGTYIKSAAMEDVPGSDKAFADLQERYAAVCDKPFGLPRKLQTPLPPLATQLDMTLHQYPLLLEGLEEKTVSITSPTRWILSFRSECPLSRLRAMVSGAETRQQEEMRQAILSHLTLAVFLKHYPELGRLLEDLRYQVETATLVDLGGLPVVMVKAPLMSFLPPDDFILQVTQLSGISAFQEIISDEAVEKIPDTLKEMLRSALR